MAGPRGIGACIHRYWWPELGSIGNANGIVALVHREYNLQKRPWDIPSPKTLAEPPDMERAADLQQEQATRQRWQVAGEALLASRAEERRVLQARKRGVAHVAGWERNGALGGKAPEEGERP